MRAVPSTYHLLKYLTPSGMANIRGDQAMVMTVAVVAREEVRMGAKDRPSRSTAYTGLHPDDDPSGGLLKDGDSPTLDARGQLIMGYTLMTVLAG